MREAKRLVETSEKKEDHIENLNQTVLTLSDALMGAANLLQTSTSKFMKFIEFSKDLESLMERTQESHSIDEIKFEMEQFVHRDQRDILNDDYGLDRILKHKSEIHSTVSEGESKRQAAITALDKLTLSGESYTNSNDQNSSGSEREMLKIQVIRLKEDLKRAKDQRSVMYYREDKKTREIKQLYEEREKMIKQKQTLEDHHIKIQKDLSTEVNFLRKEVERLQSEKEDLEKEIIQTRNLPGFKVEIMTENERAKFETEIKSLRDDKDDLLKKLTSLSETDEIR